VSTLAAAATAAAARLAAAGVASPLVDARWLVAAAAGRDPRRAPDHTLAEDAAVALERMIARRVAREPLQLIIGGTAFRTLEIVCRPGVFVPRPETEILAGLAIDVVRDVVDRHGSAVVLEPCCGTGAVALSIAAEVDHVTVHAGDISIEAVRLAEANRTALSERDPAAAARVRLLQSDLMEAFDPHLRGRVDVLVANPPYLPLDDAGELPTEVIAHDPPAALFGGATGHELVDRLLTEAPGWLTAGGAVLIELDVRRGAAAVDHARHAGLEAVRLTPDLTGAPRFLVARAPKPRR
jgi:release factor glutamine methyltransferase